MNIKILFMAQAIVGGALRAITVQAPSFKEVNNISFVNDSDKTVFICRDKDGYTSVAPHATQCIGENFFKGDDGKPAPRYFKINFVNKACTDKPDIKYALAPGRNYRITTKAALKTDEKWPNGCPPLTPEQQAREQKSGGVVAQVVVGGAVLAEDIKGGVLKGYEETSHFLTTTTPEAIKAGYEQVASGVTYAANKTAEAAKAAGEAIKGGFETAGSAIKGGLETAGGAIKGGFEDFGHKVAESKANPSNW